MREVLRYSAQPLKIPVCVAGITEKDAAHIIVYPMDMVALLIKVFDGFGTDQPAGSGHKNRLCSHLMESTIL